MRAAFFWVPSVGTNQTISIYFLCEICSIVASCAMTFNLCFLKVLSMRTKDAHTHSAEISRFFWRPKVRLQPVIAQLKGP